MIVWVNVVKSCYRKRQIKFFDQAWHEEASWESQIENVVVSWWIGFIWFRQWLELCFFLVVAIENVAQSGDESYITRFASKGCFFLDILISLHFLILKYILFSRLQLQRLSGSRWDKTWPWGLSIIRQVLQSSAYRAIVFPERCNRGYH